MASETRAEAPAPVAPVKTGVPGLDDILCGGLRIGHPLKRFRGVMTGVPIFDGDEHEHELAGDQS